jgi:hypothetical protein
MVNFTDQSSNAPTMVSKMAVGFCVLLLLVPNVAAGYDDDDDCDGECAAGAAIAGAIAQVLVKVIGYLFIAIIEGIFTVLVPYPILQGVYSVFLLIVFCVSVVYACVACGSGSNDDDSKWTGGDYKRVGAFAAGYGASTWYDY